jgi:hypothetical protein
MKMKKAGFLLIACLALLALACNLDDDNEVENAYSFGFSAMSGSLSDLAAAESYFDSIGMPKGTKTYKGSSKSATDQKARDAFNAAKNNIVVANLLAAGFSPSASFTYGVSDTNGADLASYSYP